MQPHSGVFSKDNDKGTTSQRTLTKILSEIISKDFIRDLIFF